MTKSPADVVLQHFLAQSPDGAGATDGELLTRFLASRDDADLAALVRRHAPLVWGVCRRLLAHHDAEDAFQTTFLVLVRKAAAVRDRELVANWLYGVAHQTAVRVRARAAKRGVREKQVADMPEPVADEARADDLLPLLDEELSRLPDKYRVLILLCDLEGKTRKDVARQLGCPEGTVASRLARARALLAKRLARRGLAVSGGALGAMLPTVTASASVPNSVVASTITSACRMAAGQAATAGGISAGVLALTEEGVKAMFLTKIKSVLAVLLLAALVGGAGLIYTTAAAQGDKEPPAGKPMEPAAKQEKVKEKEAFTAWGERVGRLQAGLGFRPGEKRAYRHGETVTLVVRVRNLDGEEVKDGEVKVEYLKKYFVENLPTVTGADGKSTRQAGPAALGFHVPEEVSFPPGKEVELASVEYRLRPASESGKGHTGMYWPLYVATGKVGLQYEQVFGNTSAGSIKVNPTWLKLATGKLELEVTEELPVEKKDDPKAKGPVVKEKAPPLSSKELVGEWQGENGGVVVRVKFSGADDARWTVAHVIQPGSDQKTTAASADLKRVDDKPGAVHLRFDSVAKPPGTVLARLERARNGAALKLTILPAASEINAAYKAVEGLDLYKVEPEKEKPKITPDTPQDGMKKDAAEFGEAVDGLRIKLRLDGRAGGKSPSYFTVVVENVGGSDLTLRLGESLGNGKTHHPTALRLVLIDGDKKTRFAYAEPNVAGRLDPFVVPLPAGSSYSLRCTLDKFVPEKGGEHPNLSAQVDVTKEYRVAAELVGQPVTETSADLRGFTLMKFWRGTVRSNEAEPPPAPPFVEGRPFDIRNPSPVEARRVFSRQVVKSLP